jgi:hypothetical protein
MKYILFFILLFNLSLNSVKAEGKDTTKFAISKADLKPQIIKAVSKCFLKSNFDSLRMYCDLNVKLVVQESKNGKEKKTVTSETLTDYGAIERLNDSFKKFKFSRFQIYDGKNQLNDYVIMVEIFLYIDNNSFSLDIYFVLNSDDAIKMILIF